MPPSDASPTQVGTGPASAPALDTFEQISPATPTEPMPGVPVPDPEQATRRVAALLGVPPERLVISTPPDGLCLYHCIIAWELGPATWLQFRAESGFCDDEAFEEIQDKLANTLRHRLAMFLAQQGRERAAARLRLAGQAGYPGGDELPYLAELMHCTIVEHDLQHVEQPDITHSGGGGDPAPVIHIGHTITALGAPHWVLLRTRWPDLPADASSDTE